MTKHYCELTVLILLASGPAVFAQAPAPPQEPATPTTLIERAETRVLRVEILANSTRSMHSHPDMLWHVLSTMDAPLILTIQGEANLVKLGPWQSHFFTGGTMHAITNPNPRPVQFLEFFSKRMDASSAGQAAGPAPGASSYTPLRTQDGHPDLQGIWQVLNTAAWDIQDHNATRGVPAGRGVVEGNEIPYQPWALEKKAQNHASRATLDPEARCLLSGVPRITYMPYPFQIVQQADKVNILYEYNHTLRHIYMNGNPHPEGPIDWWMGDSRGRWDGDTLVVDAVHFTDQTWLDRAGNFHSEQLHVVERYTPVGPDQMLYEVTIEDPEVFTRPWKMSMPLYRRLEPNAEILEYECYAYMLEDTWPHR